PDDDGETAAAREVAPEVEVVARLLEQDDEQRHEQLPCPQGGGDGVDAVPLLRLHLPVGRRALRGRRGGDRGRTLRGPGGVAVGRAHSPASSASPRDASRSRSRAASAGGRPGMAASVPGEAVCSCTRAIPQARSSGPAWTSTYCIRP